VSPLQVSIASRLLLPKADSSLSDCEDSISTDLPHLRFAIADGATEGFDSRRWSRYLTRAWISTSSSTIEGYDLVERVRPLGERLEKKWSGRRLSWYLEEKAAGGSFAAFLGVQLNSDGTWSAVALGDACLVIERDRKVQDSFPLSSAAEFSSRPILVGSKTDRELTRESMRLGRGVCLAGDVVLLMSDAIACWYLGQAANAQDLLDEFHAATSAANEFLVFVERERAARRLRNDDVAVVKLIVSETQRGD
jgi:hypothetical protein